MYLLVEECTRGQRGPRVVLTTRGCWEWIGARTRGGYGQVKPSKGGATQYAHRWVFAQAGHVIPPGYQVDHLCKNTVCVNPAHLEAVTAAVNTRRSSTAKLADKQVGELRREYAAMPGVGADRCRALAEKYDISPIQAYKIATGRSWRPASPRLQEQAA